MNLNLQALYYIPDQEHIDLILFYPPFYIVSKSTLHQIYALIIISTPGPERYRWGDSLNDRPSQVSTYSESQWWPTS